jgi:hypothetical protein
MDEIKWYGWFIDYWMEEGLLRCMFTNKITTPEHWGMLMVPTAYTKEEMAYDLIVGPDTNVTASYDPHCVNDLTNCHPLKIISAEKLIDLDDGPAEGRKIAETLQGGQGIEEWLIDEEAWPCIWTELIVNKKGLKTFVDRDGFEERNYNFSQEMLDTMIAEVTRLIDKYGSAEWNWRTTAQDLVALLLEHRALLQEELDDVIAGRRLLGPYDFLGPKTRRMQRESGSTTTFSDQPGRVHPVTRRLEGVTYSHEFQSQYDFRHLEKMIQEKRNERMEYPFPL